MASKTLCDLSLSITPFHLLSSSFLTGLKPHWNLLISSITPHFLLLGAFTFSAPLAQNTLLQSITCRLLLIIHVSFEISQQREVPSGPKLWETLRKSPLYQLILVNFSLHLLPSEIILCVICLLDYGLSPLNRIKASSKEELFLTSSLCVSSI